MKLPGTLPCLLAAAGLAAVAFVLRSETDSYRRAVETWAERDLSARAQLAAESIQDALSTGDLAHLHAFADARRADGLRLTILSRPGGMVFDSEAKASGNHADRPEIAAALAHREGSSIRQSATTGQRMLYCARQAGDDFIIRLAIPYETVIEPIRRNRPALFLAGLVGAVGILLILLFTLHLIARNRALARERDLQRRLLAEMRRVADFRRDFVANVSHEIKTPLTGILGVVEILDAPEAASIPESDRRELLTLLRREATRLDALAHDILSLARLEHDSDATQRNFAPTDLADVLAVAADRVRPSAEAARVKLVVTPASPLVLPCDARLVEQALVNLAANAIRHSDSPDVTLTLTPTEHGAAFAVTDHGVGLDPSDAARVFERFYRVDRARDRNRGGTGLGLAIVKHVAILHGGDASVTSTPGHGATFTFTLNTQTANNTTNPERVNQ